MRTTLVSLFLSLVACGASSTPEAYAGKKASLEFYVMSQCPYGVQVEQAMNEVVAKLGPALDVKYEYIGDGVAGSLSSMHGPDEVKGDIAQLCANVQLGARTQEFLACQNENPKDVANNWKSCGEKLKVDVSKLETCVNGDEGQKLAAASFEKAKSKGASGSPTIFMNGKPYEGGRKSRDFLRAVCAELGAEGPQACKELPEAPKFEAIFLSDSRCAECDIHKLEDKLKSDFAGVTPVHIDTATAEGRALYDRLHAVSADLRIPTILLPAAASSDKDGFSAVERFVRPLAEFQELRLGGKFDPTAEICNNQKDDDADGQVDCADSGCTQSMECRPEVKGKVDMFVMSQCPYGAKALIAAEQVQKQFGKEVDFEVHFIGQDQGGSLNSMHGPTEVEYDLYEVCAQSLAKDDGANLAYMGCISQNYRSPDLEGCAKKAGIDAGKIAACAKGAEGQKMLKASFASAGALNIGASPTFLSNNRRTFNAIAAGPLQQEICKDNPGLKGCANVVIEPEGNDKPVNPAECGN
jgi:protein-disulfide isomerase